MKRKVYPYMAALAMCMASDPYFSLGSSRRTMSEAQLKRCEEYKRERNHRLNPVNMTEHEFVIKGEHIMASSRKTALKIYANRHPEKKRRK